MIGALGLYADEAHLLEVALSSESRQEIVTGSMKNLTPYETPMLHTSLVESEGIEGVRGEVTLKYFQDLLDRTKV